MGTILQQRVDRFSTREREWKKRAPWNNSGPDVGSTKMGRRQSQRKSVQPPRTPPCHDNATEKKPQQRRRHKPNSSSARCNHLPHSARGTSKSPSGDRKEPKVQQAAQRGVYREQKHTELRGGKHAAASLCHLSDLNPDLVERRPPHQQAVNVSAYAEEDSDTDLSESERLPLPTSDRVPPQLDLRPEVIDPEDSSSHSHRPRSRGHCRFHFPDFLPPPFNSWSLNQLVVFYNSEGGAASRPRPVGPLERYLERLLQLEWHQIQTVQEESGKSTVPDLIPSCHRSSTSTSTRLSSPKSILQCQRAFPLTFLSSLASHSALLSGCACTPCHVRFSACSVTSCRSTRGHVHQSRLGPLLERRDPLSLPKRSYSETRARSSDRSSASRAQSFSSPVRGSSHLRRMQALGNIRNPAQAASTRSLSTARDASIRAGRDCLGARGDALDCRPGGGRRRSISEQRSGIERRQGGSEKVRSGSECRRAGAEQRRAARLREQEIKPDAVTAIMDNLPGSKHTSISRTKQVEFVT